MSNLVTPFISSDLNDLPEESKNAGYVYVLCLGDQVKIGKSKNVKRRFNEIRQMSGKQIEKYCLSPECSNYHKIEKSLHHTFKEFLVLGEWFSLEFEKAVIELSNHIFLEPNPLHKEHSASSLNNIYQAHIDKEMEDNPIIAHYLKENGIKIYYCEETKELIATDGDAIDLPFKSFIEIAIAFQRSGVKTMALTGT